MKFLVAFCWLVSAAAALGAAPAGRARSSGWFTSAPGCPKFNAADHELYRQAIPNVDASEWLERNVLLFPVPGSGMERTSPYFRWWTFRKHIRQTAGWIRDYGVSSKRSVGWQIQHDSMRGWAPFLRGPLGGRAELPGGLRSLLVPAGWRTAALQFLGGGCVACPAPGATEPGIANETTPRSGRQLRGLGERTAGWERPLLAKRR